MLSCIYNILFNINGLIHNNNSWDTNNVKKFMYFIKKFDTLLHSITLEFLSTITIVKMRIKKSVYY